MRDAMRFLAQFRPTTFVLENVLGLADFIQGCDKSALQVMLEQIEGFGYEVHTVEVDLAVWISVARPRSWTQKAEDLLAECHFSEEPSPTTRKLEQRPPALL